MEAIILAGGLGMRLKSVVNNVPKSMAPIKSKPFLAYQLDLLIASGITKFILSVGYKSSCIKDYFSNSYAGHEVIYATEKTLLGTGGAIKNAMKYVLGNHVVVANGDSFFIADIHQEYRAHISAKADITLALKPMENIKRYGTVQLDSKGKIKHFLEKKSFSKGLINAGLYIFNVDSFRKIKLPEKFSIERDFFEKKINELNFLGVINNGYFLDIGIPEDFKKAQMEISVFSKIDKSWTLFLDRDGVINKKIDNSYVKSIEEFEFIPETVDAIVNLSKIFGKIIVVTNQQGVGKKLMTKKNLKEIHDFLLQKISEQGGHIDAIYYAPTLESENSIMRKPKIGMAITAKKEYPNIEFTKSIMLGDSQSDMEFGSNANMIPVLVDNNKPNKTQIYSVATLSDFNKILSSIVQVNKK